MIKQLFALKFVFKVRESLRVNYLYRISPQKVDYMCR